jgi:hypothetical protein
LSNALPLGAEYHAAVLNNIFLGLRTNIRQALKKLARDKHTIKNTRLLRKIYNEKSFITLSTGANVIKHYFLPLMLQ